MRELLEKSDDERHIFNKIFQPLNKVKTRELETYGEINFNHRKFTVENVPRSYPVWAFCKFTFTSVNMDHAMYVIRDRVESALERGRTRKRHRNKKRYYFLNVGDRFGPDYGGQEWLREGCGWKSWWQKDHRSKHRRRNELRNIIKEDIRDS